MKGLFGKYVLSANTEVAVMTVNANVKYAEINVNVLNPTPNDAVISVAFSSQATTPDPSDYVEKGLILTGDGSVLVRSNESLSPGEKVFVKSDTAGVVVRVSGVEHV